MAAASVSSGSSLGSRELGVASRLLDLADGGVVLLNAGEGVRE